MNSSVLTKRLFRLLSTITILIFFNSAHAFDALGSWKTDKGAGKVLLGSVMVNNRSEKSRSLSIWDPVSRSVYARYDFPRGTWTKELKVNKDSSNVLYVSGNWGVQLDGWDKPVYRIDEIAEFRNNRFWYLDLNSDQSTTPEKKSVGVAKVAAKQSAQWDSEPVDPKRFGRLYMANYGTETAKLTLWNPVVGLKFKEFTLKPNHGYYLPIDGMIVPTTFSDKQGLFYSSWGVQDTTNGSKQPIKPLHVVAEWDTSKKRYLSDHWFIKIDTRSEAAKQEEREKLHRRNLQQCKKELDWYQYLMETTGELLEQDSCQDEIDSASETVSHAIKIDYYNRSGVDEALACIEKQRASELEYPDGLRSTMSKAINSCRSAGIDTSAIFVQADSTIASFESILKSRRNQQASALRELRELYISSKNASENRRQAEREKDFQQWAERMNKQNYSTFLDSIGHDKSGSGLTAQTRKNIRQYNQAKQRNLEAERGYQRALAQIEKKSGGSNKASEPTAQERGKGKASGRQQSGSRVATTTTSGGNTQVRTRSLVTGEPVGKASAAGPWGRVFHDTGVSSVSPQWSISGFQGLKAGVSCRDGQQGTGANLAYFLKNESGDNVFVAIEFRAKGTHGELSISGTGRILSPNQSEQVSSTYVKGIKCQHDNLQIEARAKQVIYDKDKPYYIQPN
jgi:hypothetical protein